jgi:hypothetical protein
MHYDTLGIVSCPDADRAEEIIPSLTYRQLVGNLSTFAGMGILVEGSLPMMLVVARLVDRRRLLNSGMTSADLRRALDDYRRAANWKPVWAVEDALEQAIRIMRQAEGPHFAMARESEDEAHSAAHATR